MPASELSRRELLSGSAYLTIGAGTVALAPTASATEIAAPSGDSIHDIVLSVNGVDRTVKVKSRATLAEVLRGPLGLTGTKIACNRGACSACTVWLDGTPVCSCMTFAVEVGPRAVTTIEGLARGDRASSGPGGLHRARRDAVRLLHPGHGDERGGASRAERRSHGGGGGGGDQRAHLPLRQLPPCRRGDARRRQGAKELSHGRERRIANRDVPRRHRRRRTCGGERGRSRPANRRRCRRTPSLRSSASPIRAPTAEPKSPARSVSRSTSPSRACCSPASSGRPMRMPRCSPSTRPQPSAIRGCARSSTPSPSAIRRIRWFAMSVSPSSPSRRPRWPRPKRRCVSSASITGRFRSSSISTRRAGPRRRRSTTPEPPPGVRRANSSRRPACRSTATCAGRLRRAAATSRKVLPPRTSWSIASTARRSRHIAAWSPTASSPTGARTG